MNPEVIPSAPLWASTIPLVFILLIILCIVTIVLIIVKLRKCFKR